MKLIIISPKGSFEYEYSMAKINQIRMHHSLCCKNYLLINLYSLDFDFQTVFIVCENIDKSSEQVYFVD